MQSFSSNDIDDKKLEDWAEQYICSVVHDLKPCIDKRIKAVMPRLEKVLEAFAYERVSSQHFASVTGYGHGDQGRSVIDQVFARVLGAEQAAVRMQFVSGTHAISSALFGVLRPGDHLLSITGTPYETLEEVIGIRGIEQGSLKDFGIIYKEISLTSSGTVDFQALEQALKKPRKLAFIQRSCGYSWRPSLSISDIQKICGIVHEMQPDCVCFVDNCYGEFVEDQEPLAVGADLIAGSLIKNLGGTIVPTGGYVAGRADLVEKTCLRLTSPGIGSNGGISFDLNRLILQGLFLAPQMVAETLIGIDIVSGVFHSLGFDVNPLPGAERSDVIQAIKLGSPEALKVICRAFQACSPIGSYLDPVPATMPGYENELVMAGGTFIDGSTSEFSADAPLKSPYILFVQGGTHRKHIEIALRKALAEMIKANLLVMPQTSSLGSGFINGL